MKTAVCLAMLLAAGAWADQPADEAAIRKTIRSLNVPGERMAQFTSDADGVSRLEAAMRAPSRDRPPSEPLAADYWPFWPPYLEKPWPVEATAVRFITPDVALAGGMVGARPLLFVLRREGTDWKIAAVRFLAR